MRRLTPFGKSKGIAYMAQPVERTIVSVHENSSVLDMHAAGYRAKRTGKHSGKMREPDGTIVVLNLLTGSCSCTPQRLQSIASSCIHLRTFTGLLCVQFGLRLAKHAEDTPTDSPCR